MEQVCDNTSVQSGYGQKKYQRRCQSTASPQDDPFCVQRGSSPPLLLCGAATSLTGCRWAAPPGAHRGPRSGSGTAASVQCDGHQEGQQRQGDHADAGRVRGTSWLRQTLGRCVHTHTQFDEACVLCYYSIGACGGKSSRAGNIASCAGCAGRASRCPKRWATCAR